MRVYLLVFLAWLMLCLAVKAQDFEVTYTHIGVREGLAGANVYCAFQDNEGYLWFGTETGVSRYNGRRFENFSTADGLADNEVFKIVQDQSGRIWFSAFNGQLSYFFNGEFFNALNSPLLANVKVNSHFTELLVDGSGTVWVSTVRNGVISIKPSGEVFYFAKITGTAGLPVSLREEEGSVYAVHTVYGDIELKETMPVPVKVVEKEKILLKLFNKHLTNAPSKLVRSGGLYQNYLVQYSGGEPFWSADMTKMHHYDDGIWLCSYKGAYRIDLKHENQISRYLDEMSVTHVLKDREGSYWFTTLGNGIFYASSLGSRSVLNEQSATLNGASVLRQTESGAVLFGGSDGTFGKIENKGIDAVKLHETANRSMIKGIQPGYKKNQLILSSDNSIIEVLNGKQTRSAPLSAKSILKWKEDLYAIGTNHSLLLVNIKQLDLILDMDFDKLYSSDLENRPGEYTSFFLPDNHWITDIQPYGDGLLVATLNGVYSFSSDYEWSRVEGHDLLGKRINHLAVLEDGKSFAVATHGYGVLIKEGNKWNELTKAEGLRSNITRKIWFSHPDTLWIASNAGVDQVIRNGKPQIKSVTQSDGLVSDDVYDVLVKDNNLIAATSAGISLIDIPDWLEGKTPPLINLKSVFIDGTSHQGDSVVIDFGSKEMRIQYDGIHFSSLERLTYKYRMLGLDTAWQTTFNNEITFGRLPPGHYAFEVIAFNANQLPSEEIGRVTLIIKPLFWQQWWFLISAPLLVIILIIGLTRHSVERSKMKAQRALETKLRISEGEIKLLKAQVKPHFTFNILNSIQSMVLKEETDKAYEFLGEFAALMRKDLDAFDQNSISLKEELELLESYLKLEKLRFTENEWDYEIVLDESITSDQMEVPPMFLQPFVENTIKHGFAQVDYPGKIQIRGYVNGKQLCFEVLDNGRGLETQEKRTYASKGIAIVRKRLKLVNELNEVIIRNREDGTGVRVSIQLIL